ncbi:MAG: cysteine dioxygenase family protein [Cyclobacteriaceae bacterium]|nr:cysteine dioxygenase family protein [Cyclobacteriaceae bacterium]
MNTLTPGLQRLVDFVEASQEHVTVQLAADMLKRAKITEDDLQPWADYTHPAQDGYGRKLAYQTDKYEIMVMTWNPGDYSSVHDHGYTQWGAVQVFGNVMHQTFSNTGERFRLSKKEILPYGSIAKVNNALIHQMGNVTTNPYLTLHMYGANEPHETVTADMKVYELETGVIRETSGGAFFNLTDEEAPVVAKMKPIDKDTFVYYSSILMQYYCRYTSQEIRERRIALLRKLENMVCDQVVV